jgi:hypothetical protein
MPVLLHGLELSIAAGDHVGVAVKKYAGPAGADPSG